jgi:FkbM family methyltransferase
LTALAYPVELGLRRHLQLFAARARAFVALALSYLWRKIDGEQPCTSVYGVRMMPNFGDRTFRYCFYGTYGRHISDHLDAIDRPFVFVDIGANQGLFTLIAGRNPHCRHAVALEPIGRTFRLLTRNLDLNGLGGRVTPLRAALSHRSGPGEIRVTPNHSGAASMNGHKLSRSETSVAIEMIDAAALAEALPREGEIVIKIDVEGHEEVVLEQLVNSSFIGRVSTVFYEKDERWAEPERTRELLEQVGFTRFQKFGLGRHYDMLARRDSGR